MKTAKGRRENKLAEKQRELSLSRDKPARLDEKEPSNKGDEGDGVVQQAAGIDVVVRRVAGHEGGSHARDVVIVCEQVHLEESEKCRFFYKYEYKF